MSLELNSREKVQNFIQMKVDSFFILLIVIIPIIFWMFVNSIAALIALTATIALYAPLSAALKAPRLKILFQELRKEIFQ